MTTRESVPAWLGGAQVGRSREEVLAGLKAAGVELDQLLSHVIVLGHQHANTGRAERLLREAHSVLVLEADAVERGEA